VILLLMFMGLPELYSPIFTVDGFDSATRDRFWIGIDSRDPVFDAARLRGLLISLGASRISLAGETES
jgi:hypothetical protein